MKYQIIYKPLGRIEPTESILGDEYTDRVSQWMTCDDEPKKMTGINAWMELPTKPKD